MSLAEQNVLGACMLADSAYWQVADLLDASDFAADKNRALWTVIQATAKAGQPIDAVTIADHATPEVGQYALHLANNTASIANVRAYAEIVLRKSTQRRVADAGAKIAKLSGDDALEAAQAVLGAIVDRSVSPTKSAKTAMADLIAIMQQQVDRSENLLGVSTGLPMLDDYTAGWQAGDLVLVAGRPSMGKSLLAMQFALSAAQAGIPSHIVSLEMSTPQVMARMISSVSSVEYDSVRDAKKLEDGDWPRVVNASEIIARLPLYFDDASYQLQHLLARIRQVCAAHKSRIVVVDYLTFIRMPAADTMALAVQEVTRELKQLAKALGITVILVSQLNRAVDGRGDKRPVLSDLRESGAIEQDADVVLMIYRDEYHNENSQHKGYAELLVRKQRNGRTGMIPLRSNFSVQRFDAAPEGLPEIRREETSRPARGFHRRPQSQEARRDING